MNFVTEDKMDIYSNSSQIVGTILMGLFKAYDCWPHDLIIGKLVTYGLGPSNLRFFLIIWAEENEELKWDSLILTGVRFFLGFLNDQY